MKTNVAFIGLGSIGYPIASHIASEFTLNYYARRPEVIENASKFGTYYDSINELSKSSTVLYLFVSNYDQCKDCLDKVDFDTVKYVVVGSTISPTQMNALQSKYPAIFIDAPVSGGVAGARNKTLTTMVSGDRNVIEKMIPIISTYSKKIVIAGDKIGNGEALKSIVQLMVGINTIASAEAINLARRLNLDLDLVYETVLNSSGYSKIFENRGRSLIERDYSKRGNMMTMRKDLNIISELSQSVDLNLPLVLTASDLFNKASDTIPDDFDFSAISMIYENEGEK